MHGVEPLKDGERLFGGPVENDGALSQISEQIAEAPLPMMKTSVVAFYFSFLWVAVSSILKIPRSDNCDTLKRMKPFAD